MKRKRIRLLDPTDRYIKSLSLEEQIQIAADITCIAGDEMKLVRTKQLRGPIRELISGNHRITYFTLDDSVYFVRGFRKKTNKTPRNEIEYAEKIYKQLIT